MTWKAWSFFWIGIQMAEEIAIDKKKNLLNESNAYSAEISQ